MASIMTGIQLQDNFSSTIYDVMSAVNLTISAMTDLQSTMSADIDMSSLDGAREQIKSAAASLAEMNERIQNSAGGIQNNERCQEQFNQRIRNGTSSADKLLNSIKGIVSAYISVQGIKNVLNISDELTQTKARLEMMNDGFGDAKIASSELMNTIYASAQDARGSLQDMADVVARFGNNARDAFGSSKEVVDFANLVQKQMTIAGASTEESSNAMLQLSQALGSGVLRGDELNSIFEQAPNLIQSIADYLDVPIGRIREMAADGELSADVVKAAIFASADEINAKFEQMPMTWGQLFQSFQNSAKMALEPVLDRINELANNEDFQNGINDIVNSLTIVANVALGVVETVAYCAEFIKNNWSVIGPVFYGVAAAVLAYKAATVIAAIAQSVFNGALFACPLTWIVLAIGAVVAVLVMLANHFAKTSDTAANGFSVICGWINVVIQFFYNLLLSGWNITIGLTNFFLALGKNIKVAFFNAIFAVLEKFYSFRAKVMNIIADIAEALSKLPFIDFDASGFRAAADNYTALAQQAAGSKQEYVSPSDAFKSGANTFDAFQDGWVSNAYNNGVNSGNKFQGKQKSNLNPYEEAPKYDGNYAANIAASAGGAAGAGGDAAKTAANTGNTAANTAAIAESLDITNEELEYLRDIAERDVVNRFTTASIKVEMNNSNNISSDMDLDGIVNDLTNKVEEAMAQAAEGVHI